MPPSHDESHEVLLTHLSYLKDGIDECRTLLKAQNGRIAKVETGIAILDDRADESRNYGAGAGAVGGGFVGGLVWILGQFWGSK